MAVKPSKTRLKPESKPWQLKTFPVVLREQVVRAARRSDQTVPEWLEKAVKRALGREAA